MIDLRKRRACVSFEKSWIQNRIRTSKLMDNTQPTKLPLEDGQRFWSSRQQWETVVGEIKPQHDEPICWTISGNWYRRSDAAEMTGAGPHIMTVGEFFKWRKVSFCY